MSIKHPRGKWVKNMIKLSEISYVCKKEFGDNSFSASHQIEILHQGYFRGNHKSNIWLYVSENVKYCFILLLFIGRSNQTTPFSYTLSREYRVAGYRYSRLLFTSEDRLCANLRVQWQSTNMTSQYQFLTFAWRHRSILMTSQCCEKMPPLATMAKWALDDSF